ncbi:MAG: small-conductance mechanosensitive ion channel [Candidatus Dormibacteraeota bacterium]|nr:small-conductance mechanosensitive ion channel [Candidatus Dormibacteraeota bacterium]
MPLDSVIPTVTNWGDALLVSITGALIALLSFIPALIGAVIILIIGWVLSGILARVVETVLNKVGFEHAAERTGITGVISRSGAGTMRASHVIAELVKWFVRLIFIEIAAQALHLTAVTTLVNSIILFIPNLVVALIIVLVGVLAAQFIGRLVRGGLSQANFSNANLLGSIAEYGIIGLAVVTALNQIGIATIIVTILFAGIVGALALAAGLAFGLGGRETAAEIWESSYQQTQQAAQQLARSSSGSNDGGRGNSGPSGGGGSLRVPVTSSNPQPTRPSTSSMSGVSGPEWRTLVTVKLRDARQALPQTPEGERLGRAIDDMITRMERPSASQRVEVSPQATM